MEKYLTPINPPFSWSFRQITKLRFEAPVRAEHDKALCLLTPVAAQHLLYCSSQVVIAKPREHAAKPGKRQLVRFQNPCCVAWK